jgi:hypothetical protein
MNPSAMNPAKVITYFFRLEDGAEHRFDIHIDRPSAATVASGELPAWTALEQNQCPHCPLPGAAGAVCPAAADLVPLVRSFSALASYVRADVRVITPEREISKHTDMQTALSGLMGLILGSSACPILGRLRPLAHRHLPFAQPTELLYRVVAMHLFGCFLRGEPASLDSLQQFFDDIGVLNRMFIERLRAGAQNDASWNALVHLHMDAELVHVSLDHRLEEVRRWFGAA